MQIRNFNETEEAERRERHIQELREKLEKLAGEPVPMGFSPDCPAEIQEKFLEHVLAFETAKPVSPFDELMKIGILMPSPQEMDDAQIDSKLWEVIRGMALLGCYLQSTDHLSNRELYERLWSDLLREPTTLIPQEPTFACHIDIIGGFSREDIQIYLKYYADEEARGEWAKDFPDHTIPAHEKPPYDRDRHLPEPPYHGRHYREPLSG